MDGRKNKFKIFLLGYLCKVFPWDYTCRELCFSVSSALEMLIEKATAGILTNDRSSRFPRVRQGFTKSPIKHLIAQFHP